MRKVQNFLTEQSKPINLPRKRQTPRGSRIRAKVENAMYKLGDKWRNHDFDALAPNLWETISRRDRAVHEMLRMY